MTDQFSVELRKHFVETADEVVRADELERIQRLVAAQPQQSPWYVRLRWVVSPWAPYPNAGVRTGLILAAVVLLLAAMIGSVVVGGGGSQGPPSTPFEGSWRSTDPSDGSALRLVVGPGPAPAVRFEDAVASGCQEVGDSSFVFVADGVGQVEGDRMLVSFPSGGCVDWQVSGFDVRFDHDSLTDTLLNNAGETWLRAETPSSAP